MNYGRTPNTLRHFTEDVFHLHLEKAGEICGLGAHRPAHGYGSFGRFEVTKIVWHEVQDEAA